MIFPPPEQQPPITTPVLFLRLVHQHTAPIHSKEPPLVDTHYPPLRVVTPDPVTLEPVQAANLPLYQVPHIITDDNDPISPDASLYDGACTPVPLVHKYYTRDSHPKDHSLMENHMETIRTHPQASRKK